MIRSIRVITMFSLIALAIGVIPSSSFAAKSCLDQFYSCYNDAGAYRGLDRHLAEAECSVEYTGCVVAKLKFW